MPKTGVIFDFDGTIALSEPVHAAAWRDLAVEADAPLPKGFEEYGIGRTDGELATLLAAAWRRPGLDAVEEILREKRRHYLRRATREAPLVPGVAQFIAAISGTYPIGLATSASHADVEPTLQSHGLTRYFGAMMTVESVTRPKPDPEIYLKAALALGIEPTESYAFEDSPTGATAARAAGLRVIGVTTTYEPADLGPLAGAIKDFEDLGLVKALVGL
jgi:HAD superfamily hydrolase (TIGR01509 family)